MTDMQNQNRLYKPTSFWQNGSALLIEELQNNDLKDFRRLTITRTFFVPGYSAVEYLDNRQKYDTTIDEFDKLVLDKRFTTKLQRVFTGYTGAFNVYRVLKASD